MNPAPHLPVLLNEVLQAFEGRSLHSFVDATLGAGGHASAILTAHPEIERFFGFDQDPDALQIATAKLTPWADKVTIVPSNFRELGKQKLKHVDGMLVDLGVSSMQLDRPEKGFSFMRDGPLDMRMDARQPLTAADIVNHWSQRDLERVFRDYGEEEKWRAAAREIVLAREKNPILTTFELAKVLLPVLPKKKRSLHPLTLVFQGLRIAVNDELGVLEQLLPQAIEALAPGGRLAIITFHSLEDRIVKHAFRFAASDKENTVGYGGVFQDKPQIVKLVSRKPIVPTDEEIAQNPRCRSAKMRIIEKI